MENLDDNEKRIADYFDGNMNSLEEEEFMKALGGDEMLRNQYEDELLMRGLFDTDENELLESEEEIPAINNTENFSRSEFPAEKDRKPLRFMIAHNYRKIAAILIVLVISALLIFLLTNPRKAGQSPGNNLAVNDSLRPPIEKNNPPQQNKSIDAEKIFKSNYEAYSSKNDPVEISDFYVAYKNKNYNKVVAAGNEDYQTMGASDRKKILQQYLHLYKGLSYLALDKSENAKQQFDSVIKSAGKSSDQYFQAQWYSLLLSLKSNEISQAQEMADAIIQTSSPYKNKAAEILKQLSVSE